MPSGTQRAAATKSPVGRRVHLAGLEESLRIEVGGVGAPNVGIRVHGGGGDLHQGAFPEQVLVVDFDVLVHDERARRGSHIAQDFGGGRNEQRTPLTEGRNVEAESRFAAHRCSVHRRSANDGGQLRAYPGQQDWILHNVADGPESDRDGVDDEGAEDGEEIPSEVVGVPVELVGHVAEPANELTCLSVCGGIVFEKLHKSIDETSARPRRLCGRKRRENAHGKPFHTTLKLPVCASQQEDLAEIRSVVLQSLTRNRPADASLA